MIVNFGDKELSYNLNLLAMVQNLGISAEIYPESAKIKKQMSYADSKRITYVLMAGEDEIKHNEVTVKNMLTGGQKKVGIDELPTSFN